MSTREERGIPKYIREVHYVKLIQQVRKIQEDKPQGLVTSKLTGQTTMWAEKSAVAQGSVDLLVTKVKRLLDEAGTYADLHHQYLAYAQALDKTQSEMAWMVDLVREHTILRDRFERRNLDPQILDKIDQLIIYRTANR